jgi:hypothetical protein
VEQARLLIEQAETFGEPLEDPLLLFSVLYGLWGTNILTFKADMTLELAAQLLALANKQGAAVPRMVGHRAMGASLVCAGNLAEGREHFDRAIALYDPAAHLPLTSRFGQDAWVTSLNYRSWTFWLLGYPETALAHPEHSIKRALIR